MDVSLGRSGVGGEKCDKLAWCVGRYRRPVRRPGECFGAAFGDLHNGESISRLVDNTYCVYRSSMVSRVIHPSTYTQHDESDSPDIPPAHLSPSLSERVIKLSAHPTFQSPNSCRTKSAHVTPLNQCQLNITHSCFSSLSKSFVEKLTG